MPSRNASQRTGRTCSRGHVFTGSEPCPACWPGFRAFSFRAEVWLYSGDAAWHFATVPKATSDLLRDRFGALSHGWGSLPVMATIGKTEWKTSVFPDKKSGTYLLPLKAKVRDAEGIAAGNTIAIALRVLL